MELLAKPGGYRRENWNVAIEIAGAEDDAANITARHMDVRTTVIRTPDATWRAQDGEPECDKSLNSDLWPTAISNSRPLRDSGLRARYIVGNASCRPLATSTLVPNERFSGSIASN